MKKLALLGFLIFQGIAVSSQAAPPYMTKAESSASESYSGDSTVQTVVNTSFAFTSLYNTKKNNYTDALLAQRVENKTVAGSGHSSPKIEVTAWVDGKNKYDAKVWSIDDCADAGWQSGDFYVTSKYGVNGNENLLRAYNLNTGKYAFSFTTDPAIVDISVPKDNIKRYASYLSAKGTDSECRKNDMPARTIGELTLSDENGPVDQLVFESDDNTLARSPSVSLVSSKSPKGTMNLSIWGPADYSNKSTVVNGFSVKVAFRDGIEATIPVANDRFDVQHASLPASIKIRQKK